MSSVTLLLRSVFQHLDCDVNRGGYLYLSCSRLLVFLDRCAYTFSLSFAHCFFRYFSTPLVSPLALPLHLWVMLDIVPQGIWALSISKSIPVCFSYWIIFVDLSSSSLTLSCVSNLLLVHLVSFQIGYHSFYFQLLLFYMSTSILRYAICLL